MSYNGYIPSYMQGFARHAAESEHPELWHGLVGAWLPVLGPTGSTLRDWSGRKKHGALTNMVPASDWVMGPNGWALDFDRSNDRVLATGASHIQSPIGSLVVRCATANETVDQTAVTLGTGTNNNFIQFGVDGGNGWHVRIKTTADQILASGGSITRDQWYGLLLQMRPDGNAIYADGVPVSMNYATGSAATQVWTSDISATRVMIGARDTAAAGVFWGGPVDAVLVYDRPLLGDAVPRISRNPLAPFHLRRRVFKAGVAGGGAWIVGGHRQTTVGSGIVRGAA
jgi:hypothetical protein